MRIQATVGCTSPPRGLALAAVRLRCRHRNARHEKLKQQSLTRIGSGSPYERRHTTHGGGRPGYSSTLYSTMYQHHLLMSLLVRRQGPDVGGNLPRGVVSRLLEAKVAVAARRARRARAKDVVDHVAALSHGRDGRERHGRLRSERALGSGEGRRRLEAVGGRLDDERGRSVQARERRRAAKPRSNRRRPCGQWTWATAGPRRKLETPQRWHRTAP